MIRCRSSLGRLRLAPRGVVTVELALLLPLLLFLLMGILELGLLMSNQLALQHAAREGSRAASVGRPTADIAALVRSALPGALGQSPGLEITLEKRTLAAAAWGAWEPLGDTTDAPAENNAANGDQVRVAVEFPHPLVTAFVLRDFLAQGHVPLRANAVSLRD